MFWQSYKNTIRNLTRTPLFWGILAVAALFVWFLAASQSYSYHGIGDTDPRFVLSYADYIQLYRFVPRRWVLLIPVPFLAVVSTVLVLNRDYSDSFFEIERAGGVTPASYLFGRLAAIGSVNIAFTVLVTFFGIHYYYFTRGGVAELSLGAYLADSAVRVLRIAAFCQIPAVLFYIGLTYLIGSLFKSGFAGMVGGTGYVILNFLSDARLQGKIPSYLTPNWEYAYVYFTYFDTPIPSDPNYHPISLGLWVVMLWILALLGLAAVFFAAAYWLIRRREI